MIEAELLEGDKGSCDLSLRVFLDPGRDVLALWSTHGRSIRTTSSRRPALAVVGTTYMSSEFHVFISTAPTFTYGIGILARFIPWSEHDSHRLVTGWEQAV